MKAHSEVALFAVDAAGRDHPLIKMSPAGFTCAKFEGEASSLKLELANEKRQTSWALNLCPTESLHVRADDRGQLEVWSGTAPVAKWFDTDASPDEWPPGLVHAFAGDVLSLPSLLTTDSAASLQSLSLHGSQQLSNLGMVADLLQLTALDLSSCPRVIDLSPLAFLKNLSSLNLSSCSALNHLGPLASLKKLTSLNLSGCEGLSELQPLASLAQITSLNLAWCKRLRDLAPLAGLWGLDSLDLSGCERLADLGALARLNQLTSLNLDRCIRVTDLSALAGLTQLICLDLNECMQLRNLAAISDLAQLTRLRLGTPGEPMDLEFLSGLKRLTTLECGKCIGLVDLRPLIGLTQLTSLDLGVCEDLMDLRPLACLTQLSELSLCGCNRLIDLSPLAELVQLKSLNLTQCAKLNQLSPLSSLAKLRSLSLFMCERLSLVAPLARLPLLTELDLSFCPNIRDPEALADLPALRRLGYDEWSTQDTILLNCATRRGDADLQRRIVEAATSFELSKNVDVHASRLVAAVETLVAQQNEDTEIHVAVAAAFRTRGEVPLKTWEIFLTTVIRAPRQASQPAFEAALADLPLAEAERVLCSALLALADAPASAREWALGLAQQALAPVAASASHARDVAPAAAVFFHTQGLTSEVDAWMERGSVAQVPAWRDRVLLALLGRALRTGEIREARRLFGLMKTDVRLDEARGLLARHLAGLAQFRDAAKELDAIIDRARRASTAANALAETPAFAGDPHAGLSLLLALDGDPGTQADVLAAMVQQLPNSELVRHVAAVFAPTQGVDLGRAVDALLSHEAVTARTKPKLLAGLRSRVSADRNFVHAVLVHGTAHLLVAEGLVDDDEAVEVTTDLLEVKP